MNKSYLSLSICNLTAASVVAGLSAMAIPAPAGAQNALEEVLVTARKREERLQEVPVAISVFSGEALEEAGISSTRDLFESTPGLNFDSGVDANASFPAIRGVVASELATIRAKVSTFLDGMPVLGQQGNVPFMAIQQVEVLRGPQSAAFGRSTFGGAISYTTVDPGDTLGAEFSATGGSNNLLDLGALVSGPLVDGLLGGLVAVQSEQRDGEDDWRTLAEGVELGVEDSQSVLAKLVLTPGDNTTIELRYKWQEVDNSPTPRAYLNLNDPNRRVHPDAPSTVTVCGNGTPRPSCAYVGDIQALDNPVYNSNYGRIGITDPFVRNERERYELELVQDFASGLSLQAMGFVSEEYYERANDNTLNNDDAGFQRDPTDMDETYAELRMTSSGSSRFRYGFGISWYDYDFYTRIFGSVANFNANIPNTQLQESATNMGYFFNTTFDVTDQWTVSLEGRYQVDEVSGTAQQFDGTRSGEGQTSESFLPRLAVTYSPTTNTTFYAQAALGNNPAGVNTGTLDKRVIAASAAYPNQFDVSQFTFYDEEKIQSYEIGMKGNAYSRFSYAVNAYMLKWEGYTQPFNLNFEPANFIDANPDDGIGDAGTQYANLNFSINRAWLQSGDVTGYGAEFEGNFFVTDDFSIGLSAAYIDITYDDNACSTNISANYRVTADATTASGFPCVSIAGNALATQPDLSGALSLSYSLPLSNGMEWFTRWNTSFNGRQYDTEMNLGRLGAYSISGFRTGLQRGGWRAEAFVDNVFDDDTPQGLTVGVDGRIPGAATGAQNIAYTIRRGINYGLRVSYKL